MEPFNKILHKKLIFLGFAHNRYKEHFRKTGEVESGSNLYYEEDFDSYTMGKLVVIISENGRVEDISIDFNDDDDDDDPSS